MGVNIVKNNQNILIFQVLLLAASYRLASSSFLDRKLFSANKDDKIKDLCKPANDTNVCIKTLKENIPKDIKDEEMNPEWAAKTANVAAQMRLNQVAAFTEQGLNERPKDEALKKCKAAYADLAKGLNRPIPNELAAVSEQASAGVGKLNKGCTEMLSGKDVNMPPLVMATLEKAPAEMEALLQNVVTLSDEAEMWHENKE